MSQIHSQPLGFWVRVADALMLPLMYFLSGTVFEIPQRTHRWNNTKFSVDDVTHLETDRMVVFQGAFEVTPRILFGFLPLFHMPLFGGWREYVVLEPTDGSVREWHIGWSVEWIRGVSNVPVHGPARALLGKGRVSFFGIDASTGEQIALRHIGIGRIGDRGPYCKTPLL